MPNGHYAGMCSGCAYFGRQALCLVRFEASAQPCSLVRVRINVKPNSGYSNASKDISAWKRIDGGHSACVISWLAECSRAQLLSSSLVSSSTATF